MKWVLSVKEDAETGEHYIEFPDDFLQESGWNEGDVIEWIDNKDNSWTLRKKDDGTSPSTAE
jgi:hypothetical protein